MMYNGQCYTSFPAPPQGLPTLEQPKVKKLSPQDTDACLKRLASKKNRRTSLEPLITPRYRTKGEIDATNSRLYADEVKKRQNRQARIEERLNASEKSCKTMEVSFITESVERLYKQGQQHQKDISTKLENKYNAKALVKPINIDDVKALNERFYASRKDTQKENIDRLVQKYVYDQETPRKVVTKEQQNATVARLSARN
eukprot:TRINITY_DN12952_c0_g1_i2.p1 TRINITY_DN12952_c0_g1~~TRINITY_DN12952_c0_g1_i2.p1  ORF type:complete len:222 (+),score=57.49 TRINITY_DN12952_c0_g1_i2:67-666(+)